MSGDHQSPSRRFIEYLVVSALEPGALVGDQHLLARLSRADQVSLMALFAAWAGVLVMLEGNLGIGIILMFASFGLDKLDGYVARRTDTASDFGRHLDSFIDVFVYLVPAAVIVHLGFSPHLSVSIVLGFLIIGFGGLRLIRHSREGFQHDGATSYYSGTTVVHTALLTVTNFIAVDLLPHWNGWLAAVTIALACPLMISRYRSYKTTRAHLLGVILVLVLAGAVVFVTWVA